MQVFVFVVIMVCLVLVLVLVCPVLERSSVLYCWLLTDEIQYCWLVFHRVDSYVMHDDDCGMLRVADIDVALSVFIKRYCVSSCRL